MKNINIVASTNNTYLVKADTERFGEQEIMYEAHSKTDCVKYIVRTLVMLYRVSNRLEYLMEALKWMPKSKMDSLHNACWRNHWLTSFYGLEWGNIYTNNNDGLYIKMDGCRCCWAAYITVNGDFTRCPDTKKLVKIARVRHDEIFDFMG